MKTILLISRCPPYPIHLGDRLILWHLAQQLAQRGYTIDLLAFANRPEDHADIDHYRQWFRQVTLVDEPRRGYLRRLLWPGARFPKAAAQSWSPAMWAAIEAHIQQNRYDLAHLFGGVQVYEFRRALGNLPALITPYESYSLYLKRALESSSGLVDPVLITLRRLIARRYEGWMFTPYARTVVVSEADRDELRGIHPALPIAVIPNGIDLAYFTPQPVERDPAALLFVGNYEYAPNVDAALRLAREILPPIRAQVPEAKLWLVGHAPTPEMQALASESVVVTGRVADVRPYLAQAAAFVCPLRLGAGIKNKVLEALAMGCPLVATPLSVDGIAVQPGHDALITGDADFVEQTLRLLGDTELQRTLSQNGRLLIEAQYSWSHVADLYAALYAAVTTPHSAAT
ncbi:MAG: glycosyltransferase family 4 protein [Anaerolineae bacterium]|nr:glycosyltransferase family 4 protein [Anaerolineae bacterium]